MSEKEEIVFAIFVVVYISPKDTNMELKLKSIKKQMSLLDIQSYDEGKSEGKRRCGMQRTLGQKLKMDLYEC